MICDNCFDEIYPTPDGGYVDALTSRECQSRDSYDGLHTPAECLDGQGGGVDCKGPVELHWPGYGTRSWPRCAYHADRRIERHNDPNSVAMYADSDCVPDWFDPSYAGERWEED